MYPEEHNTRFTGLLENPRATRKQHRGGHSDRPPSCLRPHVVTGVINLHLEMSQPETLNNHQQMAAGRDCISQKATAGEVPKVSSLKPRAQWREERDKEWSTHTAREPEKGDLTKML
ncbi:unnamed protein product [Pleuronectes platessa]|uniref:Uncharacterized protein n=1 Tax=Pleuronectes platessa TaxID=8262 RepID=A0A9N7UED7_PLEPL|nr:unnamed protein product [Pleuronectes platessa]